MDSTELTDTSKSSKKRRMESIDSTAEAMDQSTILAAKSTDASAFDVLDTNCISKIFSLVGVMDLASLGSVCKKFKQIARKIFKQKHQQNLLKIDVKNSLVKTARLLRCFQNLITKLAICYDAKTSANVKVDTFLNKYCAKSLDEIQFSEVGLYSSTLVLHTFNKVTRLTVRSGMLSGKLSQIASWLPNVTQIDIHQNVQPGGIKDNKAIPSLRHLGFSFDPDCELDKYTKMLVKSNPQLISLSLSCPNETTSEYLLMLRDKLPNLQRLTLDVQQILVDMEPFKPLLFKDLRFLSVNCSSSQALRSLVIKSLHGIDRLELDIEGNIDSNCVNFIKRHRAKEIRLTVNKMSNQHLEQINKVFSKVSKIEFVVRNELSVTRIGLMQFVAQCENLDSIQIEQQNMPRPITIHIQGIKENIWNTD